jgi:hypothetical protein
MHRVWNAYFFIASLILGYEMEKYALFVVMCEFMWRKKQIIWVLQGKVDLEISFVKRIWNFTWNFTHLILAPFIEGEDYYCRKSFHSTLWQGIVDTKRVLWDYEFGWVGSMYDWMVFHLTKVGEMCIQGKFIPCKLIVM